MKTVNTIHVVSQGRSARRIAKMEAFLDAAEQIVVRQGAEALTMAALAKHCQAAVGAVYRYYPGKSALLSALQVRAVGRIGQLMERRLDTVQGPLERVACAFGTWLAFSEQQPALHRLVDENLSDPRALLAGGEDDAVQEVLQPLLARCSGLLEEAVEQGLLRPGDSLLRTYTLWAGVHGATHFRKREGRGAAPSAAQISQAVVQGLLAGWTPSAR